MAKDIDLSKMKSVELKELRDAVEAAIVSREKQDLEDAKIAAQKAASEFGFNLDDLVGGKKAGGKRSTAVAKYRNPKDPAQTWSGRGRKPQWVHEALAAGVDISEMEIA